MSDREKPQPVVAELGRPETPNETAARKAEDSRNHRSRQTVNNLVLSLLATLAAVLVIVLMVPNAKAPPQKSIDYATIASQAAGTEPDPLVSPVLSSAWRCNTAQLHSDAPDGIDFWSIGLISPSGQYVGVTQGFKANASWVSGQLEQAQPGGHRTLDGITWRVYQIADSSNSSNVGNMKYGLATTSGDSTYLVFGTATHAEIEHVARSITGQIRAAATNGASE